ncbi:MAG TPA: helix-turn-helix transcriptional regulator [Chthoniobacteraceae bacterium]|nr:helix-turn-helix transcriptional regulator [Chthoniobacteraceae bacterium]
MSVSHKEVVGLNFPAYSMGEFNSFYTGREPHRLLKRHSKILYVLKSDPGLLLNQQELAMGDILSVPLGTRQTFLSSKRDSGCWALILVINLLIDEPNDLAGREKHAMLALCRRYFTSFRRIPQGITPPIQAILSAISEELDEEREARQLKIASLVDQLLVETARVCSPEHAPRKPLKRTRMHIVNLARDMMYKRMGEPLRLSDVAWHLHLSEEHLCRIFRAETGNTVMEELLGLRLEHATVLLRGSTMSVETVARNCGFGTSSLFCRHFRQRYNMTPGQYRATQSGRYPGVRISR